MVTLFLLANVNSFVKADDFDLSDHQGDYIIRENLSISEDSVTILSEETLSQMSDEEVMILIDSVLDDLIADPKVYHTWDVDNESNLFFITIQDDFLIFRDFMVNFNSYSNFFYQNQHVSYNNRVAKFDALRSFMSHGYEFDDRYFLAFYDEDLYVVDLTEMIAARYEPLGASSDTRNINLEELKLPTDEEYSLLAYDIDKKDYQEMNYSDLSNLEIFGPELILLSGEIIDYNDSYIDYSEALMQMEENSQKYTVILRFFYSPLEPLEVGDQVEVYGKLSNNANVLAEDYEQLAFLVQWIEILE